MSVFRLFNFGVPSCRNLLCLRETFKTCKEQRALISNKTLEQLGIPLRPKRPGSPYIKFLQNIRPRIIESNPGLKVNDFMKIAAQEWSKCEPEKKKKLQQEFLAEMEVYLKNVEAYNNSITPEQQNLMKGLKIKEKQAKEQARVNEKSESLGKPRKPPSAFIYYMSAMKPQRDENIKHSEWIRRLSREWNNMSEDKKEKYTIEAKFALDKYKSDMLIWEEDMIRQGHIDVVRHKDLLQNASSKKRSNKISQ